MPDFALPEDALAGMSGDFKDAAEKFSLENPEPPVPEVPAEPAPEGAPEAAPQPVEEAPPAEPEPEPAPEPQAHTLTEEQWTAWQFYADLDAKVRADAELARRLQQALNPAPATPAPATPEPEPGWQTDDPYAAINARLAEQQETIRRLEAAVTARAAQDNEGALNRARAAYKQLHSLDDTQMQKVYDAAQAYAPLLGTYLQQGMDMETSLTKVFDTTYWATPEFRDAELQRQATQKVADDNRKAKAGSLAGSSGSVPRTPTRAMNEQERRDAMIQMMAEGVGQGTVE